MVPLDDLPLGLDLKKRLLSWARRYDELLESDFEWASPSAEAEWLAEGRRLLDPVRDELGSEYDVEYFEDYEK